MKRYLQCAEQEVSLSNLTKFCACHKKWPSKMWQMKRHLQCATDPRPFREWSEHEPVSPQPAPQHFVLKNTAFRAPASIPNFTKYCACHEKWHLNFTKYCTCHEKWHLNFTKYCTCHEKWHLNFTKYCTCHEKWQFNFTKYCACQDKWHLNFTKYCTCHEKWLDSSIAWLFYYLTLLLLDSTITWVFYYLTLLLLSSPIT